ncbi:serine/threonine protein phosphatase [Brachyspira hampsonii]|uniref:Serine/threonine protein phosphatase n=1 Tax=Brachyspira hampsonii TaxID=1287055 RepID=A0AAC9TSM0_9SPIR|nr:serine/threonine protein phosphatase [Brachyspira hampsonii]ASJ21370.1 serine/threonine protein phosphatase [Brachyspira hampsonii]ELV04514.1 Serine/Threonine protein phosphatase [Brachyspira hampsonii 30599]MBW5379861.1 serine/threonine protein phosphatase [Brachyspira hampsonii]OEJ17695.1 serine/threonine protein phosphatase [Brachyspira hampsonii]
MNIFAFTKKGTNTKINTDTILFNNESISGNPLIIDNQNNYSHYINNIEGTAISLIADGLGDTFASKLAASIYNENFLDLLELVGEQEVSNWIMHNFIKLEVIAARDSADDKEKSMAGASIAGVLYHKFAGVFVFNAGDCKVFAVGKNRVMQISRDHISGNALENCACAGGGHYITIEGARRNPNYNYFIASNSMIELLLNKYENIEKAINDIMSSSNTEEALNKINKITEGNSDNVSALALFNIFE